MEKVSVFKTSDGNLFELESDAMSHEQAIYETNILKTKEIYVRERLKESVYGHLFINEYSARKHTNILPDSPLVQVLIRDTYLVKEIINHLETIK